MHRTHYQPQFSGAPEFGVGGTGIPLASNRSSTSSLTHVETVSNLVETPEDQGEKGEKKKFKHVFQTIFLDRDGAQELWTKDEINKDEIILEVRSSPLRAEPHALLTLFPSDHAEMVEATVSSSSALPLDRAMDVTDQRLEAYAILWSVEYPEYARDCCHFWIRRCLYVSRFCASTLFS